MSEKIYVIGHLSPDLDSVAAAIAYAQYKNTSGNTDVYEEAIAGDINKETAFVLGKFNIKTPKKLDSIDGKKLVLVDHNEASQRLGGGEGAKIVEILDHHKMDFKNSEAIEITIKPWGASCSIIADMYEQAKIEIDRPLAGIMLSAILVDTVITKSPTCIAKDVETIKKLSLIAGIQNFEEFGMELFKVRSSVVELSAAEIIKSDFKDFNFKQGKFGIGQVETVDLGEIEPREEELMAELMRLKDADGYHSVILFITDILKGGSRFLVATDDKAKVEAALGAKLENGRVWIDGIMSRKKQVAPKFTEKFDI